MDAPHPETFFADDPVEVAVSFGEPRRQRRWTVAVRGLLVLPQLLALSVLGIVATLLTIIGWFAALALGRLPRWIALFQLKVIAYSIRVNSYAFMLLDAYPPFAFRQEVDYPITVAIGASYLSRLKVFFRWLLALPAYALSLLALQGLLVLSPVLWAVTLVRGRMPQALFGASAAVIRYQARYSAYIGLVTDEYPQRLFGDVSEHLPEWESDEERQRRLEVRLTLTDRAKSLVGLAIALGIAVPVGQYVVRYELRPQPAQVFQLPQSPLKGNPDVVAAEARLEAALLNAVGGDERSLGEAYLRFAASIERIASAQSELASVGLVVRDSRKMGRLMLAASTSKDGGLALGIDPTDPPDSPGPAFLSHEIAMVLGPGPNDLIR